MSAAAVFHSTVRGRCSSLAPTNWIALIGDAAHAVAPFTGEGINSALESAMLLSDILATPGASCAEFDEVNRAELRTVRDSVR